MDTIPASRVPKTTDSSLVSRRSPHASRPRLSHLHEPAPRQTQEASTAAKVIDRWEERAWSRRREVVTPIGGQPDVHYRSESPRRVQGGEPDMMWSFVENLLAAEVPAAINKVVGSLSEVIARVEMALEDAAGNARDLRRAERQAATDRLEAMRISYESRLRELGARHHADVEAWKKRELNKVRDAAVAEVRRVQLDADRVCGEANMHARVSAAQSDGLVVRVREVQSDAAEFAAVLARAAACNDRRAIDGVRRMRAARVSRIFHGWRLAVERSVLGVRVETLTRMLYDAQDKVAELKKDLASQDAKWEKRVDAVSKMAKCRNMMFLMEKCSGAIVAWSRRARRTAGRIVVGSCVPEERPGHLLGDDFRARLRVQKRCWDVGGLAHIEERWRSPKALNLRKRIVHNAKSKGRKWLMFSRWRRRTFDRHLKTLVAAELFGRVAMKIILKRWLEWADATGAQRRAEEEAQRENAKKEAGEAAKKAQVMSLLAGNHNKRYILLSSFKLWVSFHHDTKRAQADKLKRVLIRMQLHHAATAIRKWCEGILKAREEVAHLQRQLWVMRLGRVVLAWQIWARRSADPLLRSAYGTWHDLLLTGAREHLQPWLNPVDTLRLMMLVRVRTLNGVWRRRLWDKVVPCLHHTIRNDVLKALMAAVKFRPILLHFKAWREFSAEIREKNGAYNLWFRKTLPKRRALTAWTAALTRRRAVEEAAAKQFPLYHKRKILRSWWLMAAENLSRGPPGGNTAAAAAVREEEGSEASRAAWVAWESRGRPLQHWLGRALTIAANIPWHRSALMNKEGGAGAAAAQVIDAGVSASTKTILDRTLLVGKRLNRDRDAYHGALGVHRRNGDGMMGEFGSRPKIFTKLRNTEGDAFRIISDALEHAGEVIEAERKAADARVFHALNLVNDSEDRERRRRQITLELFHQRGEMSRAAAAVAAVKASGDAYDVQDRMHQQAVQHIVRVSSAKPRVMTTPSATGQDGKKGGGQASVYGDGGDAFDGTVRFDQFVESNGRPMSAVMYGQEFTLPAPGKTRSWMEEEAVGRAAGAVVEGRYVGRRQQPQRVATAPAGARRSTQGRAAGGMRGGTLIKGVGASPMSPFRGMGSTFPRGELNPASRPNTAGPRTAAAVANQGGRANRASAAGRPATTHGADNGGRWGQPRSSLPAPGAVTAPLMSRAEAEAEFQRRGLEESRETISQLTQSMDRSLE